MRKSKVVSYKMGEFEGMKKETYEDDRKDIGTKPIPSFMKKNEPEIIKNEYEEIGDKK